MTTLLNLNRVFLEAVVLLFGVADMNDLIPFARLIGIDDLGGNRPDTIIIIGRAVLIVGIADSAAAFICGDILELLIL